MSSEMVVVKKLTGTNSLLQGEKSDIPEEKIENLLEYDGVYDYRHDNLNSEVKSDTFHSDNVNRVLSIQNPDELNKDYLLSSLEKDTIYEYNKNKLKTEIQKLSQMDTNHLFEYQNTSPHLMEIMDKLKFTCGEIPIKYYDNEDENSKEEIPIDTKKVETDVISKYQDSSSGFSTPRIERIARVQDEKLEDITDPESKFGNGGKSIIGNNSKDDTVRVISYSDEELGELSFVDADWNNSNEKFFNPYMNRYERCRLREPLTDKYCHKTLHLFLRSLLMTALEREWMTEDENWNYYCFKAYNTSSGNYGGYEVDLFSDLSSKKSIGIKTKLDERSANVILSCLYVLYSKFELTSDEIIFESNYREGVLMQDSNFELAKYYDRITNDHRDMLIPLTSILTENFQLIPLENNTLQFDIWKLTYSNQTKKVVPTNVGNNTSSFMTIEEILSKYDDEWLNNCINKTSITEDSSEEEETQSINEEKEVGTFSPLNSLQSIYNMASKQQSENTIKEDNKTKQNVVNNTCDFMSPPPTNQKKSDKDYYFVDSVISGIKSWFYTKEKKA